jgi:hypothetical protein
VESYKPGTKVEFLVARRDQLRRLAAVIGGEPPRQWQLEAAPGATQQQTERRARWLRPAA